MTVAVAWPQRHHHVHPNGMPSRTKRPGRAATAPPSTDAQALRLHPSPTPHVVLPSFKCEAPLPPETGGQSNHPRLQQKSHSIHTTDPSKCQMFTTKKLRPLPPLPTTPSRSIRPLPSPPSETTSTDPPDIHSPPKLPRRHPQLNISVESANAHDPLPAEISPLTSVPPTPRTARRKRLSKLTRHLGEVVPFEMVCRDMHGLVDLNAMIDVLAYQEAKRGIRKSGETRSSVESDESENDTEEDHCEILRLKNQDYVARQLPLVGGHAKATPFTGLWIREQGGQRTAETDYGNIIHTLREL